jgi:soluble lytic murein transglycosylase-like protein
MTIDPAVLLTFIDIESSFDPKAYLDDRNGGSYGLGQLDFPTARDRGYPGPAVGLYDPLTNITYMVKVLEWLTDALAAWPGGSGVERLAAAYNSGIGHVLAGGTDAPYVAKFMSRLPLWQKALA